MAQFKTDLTLTELAVLITNSGLNKGLQYYVTDKDWLLYATSVNTLKPVSGSLHIFNGETLPTGIEPDILFIDTGIVDWDTVTNPLTINPIANYDEIPLVFLQEISSLNGMIFIGMLGADIFTDLNVTNLYRTIGLAGVPWLYTCKEPIFIYELGETHVEGFSFRAIIEFHRSELSYPIPVPHIVSAETNEAGTLSTITFDYDMQDPSDFDEDFIIKIGGSGDTVISVALGVDTKTIEVTHTNPFVFGDVITVSIATGNIKNTWGGLLAEVTDYPVVNNVPAP